MAAEVTPLQQLRLPSGPSPITAEQRYWKTFKSQLVSAAGSSITHISYPTQLSSSHSSSSSPDLFAVTSGNRVQLYSIRTRKVVKTISRFANTARSGEIRRDGRIVAAGDDDGRIQVFDTSSRAILKTWDAHKPLPVWTVRFSPSELTTLMSCSDDKTVRLWDLPSNGPVTTFNGHTDYVRTGNFIPNNSHVVVSGSYDSTVRIWDARAPHKPVLTFRHDAAIEAVLPMPSGTTILAAAGPQISVLDLVAAKPKHVISNHQKTVMSLSLASGGRRLVSGGLDGHVKVFETSGWNVVAGLKYSAPVHAVSVIPSGVSADGTSQDRHLAVATFAKSSSFLSLRTRLSGPDAARQREREKEMQALLSGSIAQYDSAKLKRKRQESSRQKMDELAAAADAIIGADVLTSRRRHREVRWQKLLRQGRYGEALDLVLDKQAPDHAPLNVLTLLMALRHRSALRDALTDRDEESVMPILHWVCAHVSDPRYVDVCVDTALLLIDLYSEYAGQSPDLEQAFRTLYRRIKTEVERAQAAAQTGGMLESLILGGST